MDTTDSDLSDLIARDDHLNVLRYARVHQIRNPQLVLRHGRALLGRDLSKKKGVDELSRFAALEQICYAAVDADELELAELCLERIKDGGIAVDPQQSTRFRMLLGRCLEAEGDYIGADLLYDSLLKENPCNAMALKRKYCVFKCQPEKQVQALEALNAYLERNFCDASAWYEMALLRLNLLGDYKGAAYALEEVLMNVPSDSDVHCLLAECYATIGGLEYLSLARKHMAQALELDPQNKRAMFGLVSVANSYLELSTATTKKKNENDNNDDEAHDVAVARELVKYGAERLVETYSKKKKQGGSSSTSFANKTVVEKLMKEYNIAD